MRKVDIKKPLYARCYDVDTSWHGDDVKFLDLKVVQILLPTKYQPFPIICTENGEQHQDFEFVEQEADHAE